MGKRIKRPARERPARFVTVYFFENCNNLLKIKIFLILHERTDAIFGPGVEKGKEFQRECGQYGLYPNISPVRKQG